MSAGDIATEIGYRRVSPVLRRHLNEMIGDGALEYLCPDAPRSSEQKLRLAGRRRVS